MKHRYKINDRAIIKKGAGEAMYDTNEMIKLIEPYENKVVKITRLKRSILSNIKTKDYPLYEITHEDKMLYVTENLLDVNFDREIMLEIENSL